MNRFGKRDFLFSLGFMNMCMVQDEKGNVIFLYKANQCSGTLHNSEEGCVYWIPLEEFKEKELATGMKYVLQIMTLSQMNECYMHLEGGILRGVLVKKQVR